jgi:hypothetical protein
MSCGAGQRADASAIAAFALSALQSSSSPAHAGAVALSAMECMPLAGSTLFSALCQIDPRCSSALAPTPESKEAFEDAAALFASFGPTWTPEIMPTPPKRQRARDLVGESRALFSRCAQSARAFSLANPMEIAANGAHVAGEPPPISYAPKKRDDSRYWLSALLCALESGQEVQGSTRFIHDFTTHALRRAAQIHQSGAFKRLGAALYGSDPARASAALAQALLDSLADIERAPAPYSIFDSFSQKRARNQSGQLLASHMAHISHWSLSASSQGLIDPKAWWSAMFGPSWERAEGSRLPHARLAWIIAAYAPRRHIALCLSMSSAALALGSAPLPLGHAAYDAWDSMRLVGDHDRQMASLFARLSLALPDERKAALCLSNFNPPERALIERLLIQGFIGEAEDIPEDEQAPSRRPRL